MKKKSILLYGIGSIAILIIAAAIFLGKYTDRLVDPYVRSLLEETKPWGHKIEYQKIRVNLFSRTIIVKDTKMYPDTSIIQDRVRIEIAVSAIKLTGFRIWKLLFQKKLIVGDFLIEDPDVKIVLPLETKDAVNEVKERRASKPKQQLLTQIFLDRIIISGGDFKLFRSETLLASTDQINFLAQAINVSKNSMDEPIGYTFGDVSLSLRDIDLYGETSFYDMKLGSFEAGNKDTSIVLKGFRMIPKYDKKEFSKRMDYQTDRFDVKIGRIAIEHVGLERWLAGEPLIISKVQIDSLDADIYRDKNVPFNMDHFPLFYNESFMKLNIPIRIDTTVIDNSKILYGELAPGHPVAGTILLDNFALQLYDLTNQVAADTIDNSMHAYVQAKVMGEGNMRVELILPLQGDMHKFRCYGSVGSMQLSPVNDMLEPSINMKIKGGKVDRMTFDFTANDTKSDGWMEFLFSDLDVALVKKEPEKQWGFVSLLANAVAISNNPVKDKDLKTVEIGYERNKNKGLINYVWKTIQSGMVRTIVPSNKYRINRSQEKKETGRGKSKEPAKKKKK